MNGLSCHKTRTQSIREGHKPVHLTSGRSFQSWVWLRLSQCDSGAVDPLGDCLEFDGCDPGWLDSHLEEKLLCFERLHQPAASTNPAECGQAENALIWSGMPSCNGQTLDEKVFTIWQSAVYHNIFKIWFSVGLPEENSLQDAKCRWRFSRNLIRIISRSIPPTISIRFN